MHPQSCNEQLKKALKRYNNDQSKLVGKKLYSQDIVLAI